jgi:hypothetical protein
VVVLVLAVALLAPSASAAAETFGFGPGSVTFAQMHATHGYRLNFSENDKGYFFVRVKGHGSTTDFDVHTDRAPDGHLVADFGRRGRFDLRFVPFGKPETLPLGSFCKAKKKGVWQTGFLVGRAHFRTERGFARIDLHRIPAARESWPHMVCEYGHYTPPGHHKEQRGGMNATAANPTHGLEAPTRLISFDAIQYYRHAKPADHRVEFVAELVQTAGRVAIDRRVAVAATESSLRFPGMPSLPEELEVKPPAPFTGSAAFLRTRESTYTWSGDLAVTFPGLDPIRLTGPRFDVGVCDVEACLDRHGEASNASARRPRVVAMSTPMLSRQPSREPNSASTESRKRSIAVVGARKMPAAASWSGEVPLSRCQARRAAAGSSLRA